MKRLFLISAAVLGLTVVHGQTTFQKIYGASSGEGCNSVQKTSDGGYIVAGSTSYNTGLGKMYLLKINSAGNMVWTKTFAGTGDSYGMFSEQTNDGGYILLGYAQKSAGKNIINVVKTDGSGNPLWSKSYGGIGNEIAYRIKQTTDGGYMICGYTEFSYGPRAMYLIKINASGNIVWTKAFTGKRYVTGYWAEQTSDGGYILTGQIADSTTTYLYHVLLVKTNSNGDTLWTKTYGRPNIAEEPFSVKQTNDGGYIVTGRGNGDIFLTKTNVNGNPIWTKTYGGTGIFEMGRDVEQTQEGGFIISAWTDSYGNGWGDYFLVKTNSSGDTLWTKGYGRSGGDFPYSVEQTSDGGYIVAGESYASPSSDYNIYLIKTDKNGLSSCYENNVITTITSPIMQLSNLQVILYSGGTASILTINTDSIGTETTLCANVGIDENNQINNSITIFPNPFSTQTILQINNPFHNATLTTYNCFGQVVAQIKNLSGQTITFNRDNLPSGLYFVRLAENNNIFTNKLIVTDR